MAFGRKKKSKDKKKKSKDKKKKKSKSKDKTKKGEKPKSQAYRAYEKKTYGGSRGAGGRTARTGNTADGPDARALLAAREQKQAALRNASKREKKKKATPEGAKHKKTSRTCKIWGCVALLVLSAACALMAFDFAELLFVGGKPGNGMQLFNDGEEGEAAAKGEDKGDDKDKKERTLDSGEALSFFGRSMRGINQMDLEDHSGLDKALAVDWGLIRSDLLDVDGDGNCDFVVDSGDDPGNCPAQMKCVSNSGISGMVTVSYSSKHKNSIHLITESCEQLRSAFEKKMRGTLSVHALEKKMEECSADLDDFCISFGPVSEGAYGCACCFADTNGSFEQSKLKFLPAFKLNSEEVVNPTIRRGKAIQVIDFMRNANKKSQALPADTIERKLQVHMLDWEVSSMAKVLEHPGES